MRIGGRNGRVDPPKKETFAHDTKQTSTHVSDQSSVLRTAVFIVISVLSLTIMAYSFAYLLREAAGRRMADELTAVNSASGLPIAQSPTRTCLLNDSLTPSERVGVSVRLLSALNAFDLSVVRNEADRRARSMGIIDILQVLTTGTPRSTKEEILYKSNIVLKNEGMDEIRHNIVSCGGKNVDRAV